MATLTVVATGGTANLPATNELPVDMWEKRQKSYGALTPLTVITSRNAVDKAHNYRIDVTEEHEMPTTVDVAQSESSAGTTIYVSAYGATLVKDTLLYNPRADDLRIVDSTPTGNTVTVTCDQGGLTSTVWYQGDTVHVLLPALAENDENMRAASVANSNVYNLMQLCKLQYSLTRVENKMSTHFGGPGSVRQQLKRQKYREFRIKGEKLKYFGGRASGGTAPATKRISNGMVRILKNGTLYKDFNGTFTETGFDNWIGDYCDQNPGESVLNFFCASNIKRQIGYFAKDKIRLSPDSKRYGISIDQYVGSDVNVNLIPMPLLTDDVTRGWGFILDLSRIKLKDVDRPAFFPDAKTVGESEIIYDTYREVTSMLVANESRHAMCVGALL